jgi:hypothetical protein
MENTDKKKKWMRSIRVVGASLTTNAEVATVLGSIPASSGTGESEGRQIETVLNKEHKKERKNRKTVICPSTQAYCFSTEPVDLADFLASKDLADFLHEVLLDFLAYVFAHSVNNILSYFTITNLPIF